FFLQAEDGIRDRNVTGVQTCALPILPSMVTCTTPSGAKPMKLSTAEVNIHWMPSRESRSKTSTVSSSTSLWTVTSSRCSSQEARSEERRVGKEGRARRGTYNTTEQQG